MWIKDHQMETIEKKCNKNWIKLRTIHDLPWSIKHNLYFSI